MSEKTLQFEITTPERTVLTDTVIYVTAPTKSGEITILPGHIPLVSSLNSGVIEAKNQNEEFEIMALSGGFIEVAGNKVVILADTAERAPEIDLEKAEEARKKAEEDRKNYTQMDRERFTNVNAQLSKQLARSKAVNKWKKLMSR